MRQFYLGRNSSGYYRVYFVDPVTGCRGPGKSTHTKDKVEATVMAAQWLKEGVPSAKSHSRAFASGSSVLYSGDIKSFVAHLSQESALEVLTLLAQKVQNNFDAVPSEIPDDYVSAENPVETVNETVVNEPVPAKKRYVVINRSVCLGRRVFRRSQCERRNGKIFINKIPTVENAVLVLFFIENRLQTERIAQFLPVKS